MLKNLPLNRKEQYWTATVLPQIICGDRFAELHKFLGLIQVPQRFIKTKYIEDIAFYTEYSLRDSALTWNKKISGETPDLVIILENEGELFLIFIEAKMFDKVTSQKIRKQLDAQKKISNVTMDGLGIKKENFRHVALFLEAPSDFAPEEDEIVINWSNIRDAFKYKAGNYFHQRLTLACQSMHLIGKGAESYGQNSTGKLRSVQICNLFNKIGDFYVGRTGNLQQVELDCIDGKIGNFPYEINTRLKPGIDNPPGMTGKNWFKASEFINLLRQYKDLPAVTKYIDIL